MGLLDQLCVRIVLTKMTLIWLKHFVADILTRRVLSLGGLATRGEILM